MDQSLKKIEKFRFSNFHNIYHTPPPQTVLLLHKMILILLNLLESEGYATNWDPIIIIVSLIQMIRDFRRRIASNELTVTEILQMLRRRPNWVYQHPTVFDLTMEFYLIDMTLFVALISFIYWCSYLFLSLLLFYLTIKCNIGKFGKIIAQIIYTFIYLECFGFGQETIVFIIDTSLFVLLFVFVMFGVLGILLPNEPPTSSQGEHTKTNNIKRVEIIKIERPINNNITDDELCFICCSKEKNAILVPCKHNDICIDCTKIIYQSHGNKLLCPFCRQLVQTINWFDSLPLKTLK